MKMNEKLEIMLSRKRIKKTDFAHSIGITYRAFANYLNGTRNPRAETLQKMADQLQLTPEFLKDDSQELELTVEEQFIRKICASDADKAQAAQFLAQSRGLFAGNTLNSEDKECLIKCLMEIYEDSRDNSGE